MVRTLTAANAFAHLYPIGCDDNPSDIVGTDTETFELAAADQADIAWPLDPRQVPSTAAVMDLVEFIHRSVEQASARPGGWHAFFKHHHLTFDASAGRRRFRDQLNELFRRHGLAFVMKSTGEVSRVGSPVDRQRSAHLPPSGDPGLDTRIARALQLYTSARTDERMHAVRELWDCFERLKTVSVPGDKKQSANRLVHALAGSTPLSDVVEADMRALTEVGNQFGIRHSEVGQQQLTDPSQLDYVFGRLFNLIWTLLRSLNREVGE